MCFEFLTTANLGECCHHPCSTWYSETAHSTKTSPEPLSQVKPNRVKAGSAIASQGRTFMGWYLLGILGQWRSPNSGHGWSASLGSKCSRRFVSALVWLRGFALETTTVVHSQGLKWSSLTLANRTNSIWTNGTWCSQVMCSLVKDFGVVFHNWFAVPPGFPPCITMISISSGRNFLVLLEPFGGTIV